MPDLRDLRSKYRNLKADFDREMEVEFARRSAVLTDQIDREVWRLRFDEGKSIAKIGEQYGTKNYGTIKEILDRRPTEDEAVNVAPIANVEHLGDDRYRITVGNETVEFSWDAEYSHSAYMFHGAFDTYSDLVVELRKDNNAYAAQIEAI